MSTPADLLLETFDHSNDAWKSIGLSAIRYLAQVGQPFEAYDVTELGVDDPPHPNHWGALFHAAQAKGLIEVAGYGQSRRPTRAGGLCRFWVGKKKSVPGATAAKHGTENAPSTKSNH